MKKFLFIILVLIFVLNINVLFSQDNTSKDVSFLEKLKNSIENKQLLYDSKIYFSQDLDEVINILGEPKNKFNGEGTGYCHYDKYNIILNDYYFSDNNLNINYTIMGFVYFINDIKIISKDIISFFGKPSDQFYNNLTSTYQLIYKFDEHSFTFHIYTQNEMNNIDKIYLDMNIISIDVIFN